MKLCKDCKWAQPWGLQGVPEDERWDFATCLHPQLSGVNPANGVREGMYCTVKRANIWSTSWLGELVFGVRACGPEGKRWEPRDV